MLAYVGAATVVSFVVLNVLVVSGIDGAYRRICTDGDMSAGIVLFLALALVATVPISGLTGCAIASLRPRMTWKRLGYGVGSIVISIGVVYLTSYVGAVLTQAQQRSCVSKWTLVVPVDRNRLAT